MVKGVNVSRATCACVPACLCACVPLCVSTVAHANGVALLLVCLVHMVCARSPYSGFKLRFSMYASQTHYLARKIVCYYILQWRLRPLRARAFRRRAPVGSRVFRV